MVWGIFYQAEKNEIKGQRKFNDKKIQKEIK